jgi:hypothetical protein
LNKYELIEDDVFDELSRSFVSRGTVKSLIKNSVFVVAGMSCASCVGSIETHLKKQEGILSVNVSLLTSKAAV